MSKIVKKSISLIMVAVFGMMSLSTSIQNVNASTLDEEVASESLVPENTELAAEILMNNMTTFTDENGNKQVKIIDREYLESELNAINYPLEVEELESAIEQFNYYMVAEDGEGIITDLTQTGNNNGIQTFAITCSGALQFIGYVHSGSYYAAAALLGITGPPAVIVPLLIGLVYQAGALFC